MKVTLNHKDYLYLLGSLGELQGLVGGLVTYPCIPQDVKDRVTTRLTTINTYVEDFLTIPKEYLKDTTNRDTLFHMRKLIEAKTKIH